MAQNDLEIYKERYATWRHLDTVRWQIVQILIALVSAAAAIASVKAIAIGWLFWIPVGLAVLAIAVVQHRVSKGIRANNTVLAEFGHKIGDTAIPDTSDARRSAVHWVTIVIGLAGVGLVGYGVADLIGDLTATPSPGAVR